MKRIALTEKFIKNRKGCSAGVDNHSVWAIKREYGIQVVIANVDWMMVNSGRVASPLKNHLSTRKLDIRINTILVDFHRA